MNPDATKAMLGPDDVLSWSTCLWHFSKSSLEGDVVTALASGLFVTGTDTSVGKTYVSSLMVRELRTNGVRVGVFKPACSGAERKLNGEFGWPDLDALAEAAGMNDQAPEIAIDGLHAICPYRLRAPLAPPVAARLDDTTLDLDVMLTGARRQRERSEFVVVEGVGGWLCPLTEQHTIADFAQQLGLPIVVVARLGLGTLNHALLTIESAQRRGLMVAGIVLNDVLHEAGSLAAKTNLSELSRWTSVPILGVVPFEGRSVCLSGTDQPARIAWQQLAQENDSTQVDDSRAASH